MVVIRGECVSFSHEKENWTFPEVLEHLAQKYGIMLPEKELSPREKELQARRHRWEEIHEWATAYFHDILMNRPEGELGRQYFAKRGVDPDTMKAFRLGYAPDRWNGLIEALSTRGVNPHELAEVGLAIEREGQEGKGNRGIMTVSVTALFLPSQILVKKQLPLAVASSTIPYRNT